MRYGLTLIWPIKFQSDKRTQKDWTTLLYDPAVKGTTSILFAAAKEPSVKRVIVTSSVAAIETKNGFERIGRESLQDRSTNVPD